MPRSRRHPNPLEYSAGLSEAGLLPASGLGATRSAPDWHAPSHIPPNTPEAVMPYLHATHTNDHAAAQAAAPMPFGPAFPPAVAQQTVRLEVWCTTCSDPGADATTFRAFDAQGRELGVRVVPGY